MTIPASTTRRSALGLLSVGLLATPTLLRSKIAQQEPIAAPRFGTVVFVRHCEMEGPASNDPGLSVRGEQRAAGLAQLLKACPVTQVFATELRRTKESMQPLAEQFGLEVQEYGARDPQALATRLESSAGGGFAVVAAHANTLPKLVGLLGGSLSGLDQWGFLPESEHDRVIVQSLIAVQDAAPLRAFSTLDLRVSVDS